MIFKFNDSISYDSLSGLFFYTIESGRMKVGDEAGTTALKKNITKEISYRVIRVNGKNILAHRAALIAAGLDIEGKVVDHINGDTLDNRLINLRAVTFAENNKNLAKNRRATLRINGVYLKNGKYYARITSNFKNIHLGVFSDFFEAVCARKSALNSHKFHKNHGRES